ncbi:hypothetical protein M427DRAFT_191706 [Gonapodya prolifera JEL478]|uniref:Sorting nexin MVP1 n=1 Tax=Gonapodya prolifera (strain JEL478) TaxID=1344416 RepID=A0A139A006_GONPJ|nr:hypothetical protein M427DRAFT_191706 [Gonapodya prolifera JEL478]|eukprot:KXS10089.1 hypothetical protein M427DRAFT_191706 [Gonapodya prolifera JEL478]
MSHVPDDDDDTRFPEPDDPLSSAAAAAANASLSDSIIAASRVKSQLVENPWDADEQEPTASVLFTRRAHSPTRQQPRPAAASSSTDDPWSSLPPYSSQTPAPSTSALPRLPTASDPWGAFNTVNPPSLSASASSSSSSRPRPPSQPFTDSLWRSPKSPSSPTSRDPAPSPSPQSSLSSDVHNRPASAVASLPPADPWQLPTSNGQTSSPSTTLTAGRLSTSTPPPADNMTSDEQPPHSPPRPPKSPTFTPFDIPPSAAAERLPADRVSVRLASERGGVVFKHVNYVLQSATYRTPVVRRYSDFVWLADVLQRRYPMRLLTQLPPKRVAVDDAFLEERRRGLQRWINHVANHPVMRLEEAVGVFLGEAGKRFLPPPTGTDDEFTIRSPDDQDLASVPANVDQVAAKVRIALPGMLEAYGGMLDVVEGMARREGAFSAYSLYASTVRLSLHHSACVDSDCALCPSLSRGMVEFAEGLERAGRVARDAQRLVEETVAEELKGYREVVEGMDDLLYRRERLLTSMTVDKLRKQVQANRARVDRMQQEGAPQKEIERVLGLIDQDDKSIDQQLRRTAFIRFCTFAELRHFHRQRAQLAIAHQHLAEYKHRTTQNAEEEWSRLVKVAGEMPGLYT